MLMETPTKRKQYPDQQARTLRHSVSPSHLPGEPIPNSPPQTPLRTDMPKVKIRIMGEGFSPQKNNVQNGEFSAQAVVYEEGKVRCEYRGQKVDKGAWLLYRTDDDGVENKVAEVVGLLERGSFDKAMMEDLLKNVYP